MLGSDPEPCRQRAVLTGSWSRLFSIRSLALSLSLSLVTVKRHRGCDCHLCRQSVRLPKPISSFLCIIYSELLLLPLPRCLQRHRMEPSRAEGTMEPGERPRSGSWVPPSLCGPQIRGQSSWRLLATHKPGFILGENPASGSASSTGTTGMLPGTEAALRRY